MEFDRRGFMLSAFSVAFISSFPKLSFACGVSPEVKKTTLVIGAEILAYGLYKYAVLSESMTGIAAIATAAPIVPVAIAVGAALLTIHLFGLEEKIGEALSNIGASK